MTTPRAPYRFDNLPLRCLLTLWIAVIVFIGQIAVDQHFYDHPLGLLLMLAIAVNGFCFVPPLVVPLLSFMASVAAHMPSTSSARSQNDYDDELEDEHHRAARESADFHRHLADDDSFGGH